MSLAKNWCFTVNNWTAEDRAIFEGLDVNFIVFEEEVGENGTPHLQGYLQLKVQKRLAWLKKHVHGTAHWEVAHGSPDRNIEYCTKEGKNIHQRGSVSRQGKGAELMALITAVKQNPQMTEKELWNEHPLAMAKYPHVPPSVRAAMADVQDMDGELVNLWIWGEKGAGKSKWCKQNYPDAYRKEATKWWQHYRFQDVVWIDEWGVNHAHLINELKRWTDRYWYPAEWKGGSFEKIRPKMFVITSNHSLRDCFSGAAMEDVEALERRFIQYHVPHEQPQKPQ